MSAITRVRKSIVLAGVVASALVGPVLTPSSPAAEAANPDGDVNFSVERLAGADRYLTATQISQRFFSSGAPVAFVTTGTDFPDALSAGPSAAKLGGPVLFTTRDTLPSTTASELVRLKPALILVVGGTSAISETVRTQLDSLSTGGTTRLAGADRYATAVAVSQHAFPSGASVAYVATGEQFPDALSGGAAAGVQSAPMLLTHATSLPPIVRTELERLDPDRIMLLGGTSAVSAAVANELDSIATVERIGGTDRYETAVAMSKRIFSTDRPTAFIATGRNFPDALAGVSPAGRTRGPILLTAGTTLTSSTEAELSRISPTTAYLLGGTSVVGVNVAKTAQRLVGVCWVGTRPPAGSQQVISQVSGATKQVALTFDMGGRLVPARDIIKFLADNQVCTTFFPTGAMAQSTEGKPVMADIGRRPELFEIGNHTMHHCDLVLGGGGSPTAAPCDRTITSSFIRSELTTAATVLRSTSGLEPRPYWRPPYGSHNAFVRDNAAAVGYTKTMMWNRDTIDWDPATTTSQIVSRVTNPLPPDGTIVLFHLGGYQTLESLPQIVSTLRSNGYILTTLSDMLD